MFPVDALMTQIFLFCPPCLVLDSGVHRKSYPKHYDQIKKKYGEKKNKWLINEIKLKILASSVIDHFI